MISTSNCEITKVELFDIKATSGVKKYICGAISELLSVRTYLSLEKHQVFQNNSASDLETSSSYSNDVIITLHFQNKEKSNIHKSNTKNAWPDSFK